MKQKDTYINAKQVLEIIPGISRSTLWRKSMLGEIPCKKIGRNYIYSENLTRNWVKSGLKAFPFRLVLDRMSENELKYAYTKAKVIIETLEGSM